jgi:pyruvate/2-oxoglutarate/acetoin dehydrogenase E1 component
LTGAKALRSALERHLAGGGRIFGERAGAQGVTSGLSPVVRTPLAESVTVGAAAGAALGGARVVVELVDAAGLTRAHDVLADLTASLARSDGAWSASLVVVAPVSSLAVVPHGVTTSVAGVASDLVPLFEAALGAGRPVVLLVAPEALDGEVEDDVVALGAPSARARIAAAAVRSGAAAAPAVTVVAVGAGVAAAVAGASQSGAAVEVVDLRALSVDRDAVGARVRASGRVVVVDAAFALPDVVQAGFLHLESPPLLVAAEATAVAEAIHASLQY